MVGFQREALIKKCSNQNRATNVRVKYDASEEDQNIPQAKHVNLLCRCNVYMKSAGPNSQEFS